MSAFVATPMLGLPSYDYGPEDTPDFTATGFPDHMELDRSADLEDHNYTQQQDGPIATQRRESAHITGLVRNSEEEQAAIGNLLGALTNPSNQGKEALSPDALRNGSSAANGQPATNAQLQPDSAADLNHARLPSLDPATNDMFSHFNQPIDIPCTPNGHKINDVDVSHLRNNSLTSHQSLPRRLATPQQREFEAFARLQFEDGSYYLNTYSCELGRDVLAYQAALKREEEEKEAAAAAAAAVDPENSRSSSGRASHPSGRMQRHMGSQVQGSVISEQGGFAGIDDVPMRPPRNPDQPSMSSQESESSVVKPGEYVINPRTMPSFDYHRSTEMQAKWTAQEENDGEPPDDEQPAAVTAAHLPNPHMCPLIPIHGRVKDGLTEAESHRKISRRHVRIQWNFERDCWELKVVGRNGIYCNEKFVRWKGVVPLNDGAAILIAHILVIFRLPKTAQQQLQAQQTETEIDADEALPSVESRPSESVADDERRESITEPKPTPRINLKVNQRVEPAPPELPLGPDGLPIVKRRGPGRPPKDGIMSTRERKEREKAAKLAAMREANGGKTPPPAVRSKLPQRSPPVVEEVKVEVKPEKRKYTKRKATDENGNPIVDADGEGDEREGGASDGEPKTKKARTQREKSESPDYPSRESLTAEQLARPPESYATLLYKVLMDLYPRALPLKNIYQELKMRYPWFLYEAQTEGWQSSVRHNLNSEFGKLFDKGDKEGKGFAWRAIPGAILPQGEKKRTTQATAQKTRPPPQRTQFGPSPGQNIQWHNNGTFPANNSQAPFVNHGQWHPPNQPNGAWPQNGIPPAGMPQAPVPPPAPVITQQRAPSHTPQPAGPQIQNPTPNPNQNQSGQAQNGGVAPPPAPPAPVAPSSSAASNMPCTLDGMLAIRRFEHEMYKQLGVDEGPSEKRDIWAAVFASAKGRVLHGHPSSAAPEIDAKAEATLMAHMESFVEKYKNPNFRGFAPRVTPSNTSEQTVDPMQDSTIRLETQKPNELHQTSILMQSLASESVTQQSNTSERASTATHDLKIELGIE